MVKSKILGPVKIYHFRNYDKDGKVSIKGGVTFAFVEINGEIWAAHALCSKKDNFSRKIGRAIAIGRLEADKGGLLDDDARMPTYEEAEMFRNAVLGHTKMDVRG